MLARAARQARSWGSTTSFDLDVRRTGSTWHDNSCDQASGSEVVRILIEQEDPDDVTPMCVCVATTLEVLLGDTSASKAKLLFAIAISLRDDEREITDLVEIITRVAYLRRSFYSLYDTDIADALGVPIALAISEVAEPLMEERSRLLDLLRQEGYKRDATEEGLRLARILEPGSTLEDLTAEVGYRVRKIDDEGKRDNVANDSWLFHGPVIEAKNVFDASEVITVRHLIEAYQSIWQSQWNGKQWVIFHRGPYWLYLLAGVGNLVSPPLSLTDTTVLVAGQLWGESGQDSPYTDMRDALRAAEQLLQ